MTFRKQWHRLGLITTGVTLGVVVLQWSGALQILELLIMNQWFRLRPTEARSVPIVLVLISETDIQQAGHWPLSDEKLAKLLNRIKRDRPSVIGLDLYRDLPVEPGHADVLKVFDTTPNLIGIAKAVGNAEGPVVSPPSVLRDRGQFGVNDVLLDADGVVRRNLLAIHKNGTQTLALGTKVAVLYLKQQGITSRGGVDGTCTQLGKATFCRLEPNAGGYVRLDTGGNQTLSNFLRTPDGFPVVSFTQVMTDQVPGSLFRDKIVFIGAKADSLWGDRFYTPYSTDSTTTWAGVEIHANMAAQIITSAMEGRPVLQGFPDLWECAWILLGASLGTLLGWSVRSLRYAMILIPGAIGALVGSAYGFFLLGWWAVLVAPILACLGAASLSRSYWIWYTLKQANLLLELKVQERTHALMEKNLALEQARLVAERANQALERLARTDELTQVANRRFFNEYLEQEWQRAQHAQQPLSLLLIDIDFFKLYNDTYGHPAGDTCLTKVAHCVKAAVKRATDLVARYGGEEFAVILPNTAIAGAMQIARRIQAEIQALQIPHSRSSVSHYVTLSIGVACQVPTHQAPLTALIDQADHNLYRAKEQGRAQIVIPPVDATALEADHYSTEWQ